MKNRVTVFVVMMAAIANAEVGVSVDFGKVVAPFRPALHSAGFSPWYRHSPHMKLLTSRSPSSSYSHVGMCGCGQSAGIVIVTMASPFVVRRMVLQTKIEY